MAREIEGQFKIYEAESTAYFNWLETKLAEAKLQTANAIKIAGALAAKFDPAEFGKLTQIKVTVDGIVKDISDERKKLVAHQGFRGNLGLKTSAGAPPRLELYEEVFKKKRKVQIDKNDALNPKIDKAKDEYTKRVDAAIQLAEKYRNASGKVLVTAHTDLTEMAKTVKEWLNLKSANYTNGLFN